MPKLGVAVGGAWKNAKGLYVGVGGAWKPAKAAYVGVGNAWKKFWPTINVNDIKISYTGNYTDEIVTMGDGKQYRLITMTSSGTLKMQYDGGSFLIQQWACNGGGGGYDNTTQGADGGHFLASTMYYATGFQTEWSTTITIPAANNGYIESQTYKWYEDVDKSIILYDNIKGSGGGGGGYDLSGHESWVKGREGGGISTRPFEDSYFDPHCAGGGGGGSTLSANPLRYGNGGSDGGNGEDYNVSTKTDGHNGGFRGGGDYTLDATYYGGGAGGVEYYSMLPDLIHVENYGYQGVQYFRIPVDQ